MSPYFRVCDSLRETSIPNEPLEPPKQPKLSISPSKPSKIPYFVYLSFIFLSIPSSSTSLFFNYRFLSVSTLGTSISVCLCFQEPRIPETRQRVQKYPKPSKTSQKGLKGPGPERPLNAPLPILLSSFTSPNLILKPIPLIKTLSYFSSSLFCPSSNSSNFCLFS